MGPLVEEPPAGTRDDGQPTEPRVPVHGPVREVDSIPEPPTIPEPMRVAPLRAW
jgi:hypothetical protein